MRVRVAREGDAVLWSVRDDGVGIADIGASVGVGNGIAGMRERVWAHGSDLEIARASDDAETARLEPVGEIRALGKAASPHFQIISPPGACRKSRVVMQHRRPNRNAESRMQTLGQNEKQHEVVIAGGGPTGLMLAAELALAGIDVVIVERRASQELSARARWACTRARLKCSISAASPSASSRRENNIRRCISRFRWMSPICRRGTTTRSRLWQRHTERILAEWVDELNVPVLRGCEVIEFRAG